MRITRLAGSGVLSFNRFDLPLSAQRTMVVGPNGAGKSNLGRLLEICRRVIECGDGARGDAERMLAIFRAAGHAGSDSPGIEVRVGIRLTSPDEKMLLTEFVRAMVTSAITANRTVVNMPELDAWATGEISETRLTALIKGEIVASHPGTQDGGWECGYEFTAADEDGTPHRYRWILLGHPADTIHIVGCPSTAGGRDVATRVTGDSAPPTGAAVEIPGKFELLSLLPHPDQPTMRCVVESSSVPSDARRRFAQIAGLALHTSGRQANLATVFRVLFRQALVQTSDQRLLPSGGRGWSSAELALTDTAEARLPEFLLRLKNGEPADRARYQGIKDRFFEFTQGRGCEVRLVPGPQQESQPGQEPGVPADVPAVWATVDVVPGAAGMAAEIPIEFAGAGAWEALVLASVLSVQPESVVVLDEPAVALHPTLQRQFAAHLQAAAAQFLVITHSAELVPLGPAAGVQIVRLDRDERSATRAWPLSEACRLKMSRKLAAKGNERLPFAWRALLCEGEDDVEAVLCLSERMGIDLRHRNIAVADCGGRDNLPDYIGFCAQLGLRYLALMDADTSKPDAALKAQAVRTAVTTHGGGELAEFPENLEATFGVVKHKPSLVPAAIQTLQFTDAIPDPATAPAEITQLAHAIHQLAGVSWPGSSTPGS